MSKNVNKSMPVAAMVGLCFSLLAVAFTVVVASSLSGPVLILGFASSLGATAVFSAVLFSWVVS